MKSLLQIFKNEDGYHIVDKEPLGYFATMKDMEEHFADVLKFIQNTQVQQNLYKEDQ